MPGSSSRRACTAVVALQMMCTLGPVSMLTMARMWPPKKTADARQGWPGLGLLVEHELVAFADLVAAKVGVKGDLGAGKEAVQVDGERAVFGQTQCLIAIAPVFNQGDVGMGDSYGCVRSHSL